MTAQAVAALDDAFMAWAHALVAQAGAGDTQERADEAQAVDTYYNAPAWQRGGRLPVVVEE